MNTLSLVFIYLFSVKVLRATLLDANPPPCFLNLYLCTCFGYSKIKVVPLVIKANYITEIKKTHSGFLKE